MTPGKRRGYSDPFPRLPPGVTPSDIDRAAGVIECPHCGNEEREGHTDTCPTQIDWCDVCNPPPESFRGPDGDLVFCDDHDEEDLRARLRAEPGREPGPPQVPPDEDKIERLRGHRRNNG